MDERFRIVFAGELQGQAGAEDVIAHLVATFKLPEAKARTLVLDGNRHIVKKNLDEKSAHRYRSALEKAGMIVQVEPMAPPTEELHLTPLEEYPASPSEQKESAPASAADFEPDRCPACGAMQVEDGVCRKCGVAREKYLAAQSATQDRIAAEHERAGAGTDPYAAPRADLGAQPRSGDLSAPRAVPAGRGWSWIVRGFWHFKTNAVAWILSLVVMVGISIVLSLVPFIGAIAASILGAVFTGGLMLGAKTQDEGGDFRLDYLFAGFRDNLGQLALVGLLYMVGGVLIAILVGGLMLGSMLPLMSAMDPSALKTPDPTPALAALGPMGLIAILVGALLFVPLLMSFLFAPALVMLDQLSATEAMKLSFVGCLKNMLPFLVYGIAGLVLTIVGMIPMGLGLLVVWPTLTAAIYAAYRDIYFE